MDRATTWFRENPQLAGLLLFAVILALVLGVLAWTMLRAGASLRPLVWVVGFIGIIAVPQGLVHLFDGLSARRARAGQPAAAGAALSAPGKLEPAAWTEVFGPKADPALITDPRVPLGPILKAALEAKLSFNRDGESALAARFDSAAGSRQALAAYREFFMLRQATGSNAAGWTGRRHGGQGEWVHVVAAGPELYAWTGPTPESVLARRARALGPVPPAHQVTSAPAARAATERLVARPGLLAFMIGLNVLAAVGWFFKGSAWAARVDGGRETLPASAAELRQRLTTLNTPDVPTAVTPLPDGAIEVTWRYADARWFDLMRVHGMKRIHRLVLHFDEADRTVRVREYWSAFDASAGRDGARVKWQLNTGIQFFATEHVRVLGAELDASGRATGKSNPGYDFDLQALKAPIIERVTAAGWTWQPVTWNAPRWLRWATE